MPSKQSAYTVAVSGLVEDSAKRTVMVVINMSGAETAYINDESSVSAAQGIPILPGANLIMEKALGWSTEKPWWKMGTGNGNLNVYEGFGKIATQIGVNGNGEDTGDRPPGNCPGQSEPIMGD